MPDNKFPEVDLKKWGDRIIDPGPLVDESQLQQTDHPLDQPVGIIVEPEQIVRLSRAHAGPKQFNQMLLERFKDAGAPVEGPAFRLKLHRGKVFKLKTKPGDFDSRYIWLPDAFCRALAVDADSKQGMVN